MLKISSTFTLLYQITNKLYIYLIIFLLKNKLKIKIKLYNLDNNIKIIYKNYIIFQKKDYIADRYMPKFLFKLFLSISVNKTYILLNKYKMNFLKMHFDLLL